jgi:uncharacterized membrane protein YphA (DoxX/SURF4 family)
MTATTETEQTQSAGLGLAILRIALGLTVLATWWGNVGDDFYTADGLRGFFDWAFTPAEDGGNGSSLGFVESIIDGTVLQAPGFFGFLQTVVEFLIGLGLLIGGFTRLFSFLGILFFTGLFLTYFGGEEWIWTYVILIAGAVAVFLGSAGRTLGVDQLLAARGRSPFGMLW